MVAPSISTADLKRMLAMLEVAAVAAAKEAAVVEAKSGQLQQACERVRAALSPSGVFMAKGVDAIMLLGMMHCGGRDSERPCRVCKLRAVSSGAPP
jgi:hypothetical protein